ncbi:MAG: hypothetical protein ACHQ53_18465, partial [Polyangiales bacterium]
AKDLQPQASSIAGASGSLVAFIAAPIAIGLVAAAVFFTRPQSAPPRAASAPAVAAPTSVATGSAVVAAPSEPAVAGTRSTVTLDPSAIETTTPAGVRSKRGAGAAAAKQSAGKPALARLEPSRAPGAGIEGAMRAGAGQAPSAANGADVFEAAQPARTGQVVAASKPEASHEQEQPAVQPPAKPTAPAPVDESRLEREMQMLAVAQHVLGSDPQRALNLARQGEAEFKGSMFTEERQQVLLLALVQLGRLDEAKKLARPYLARYPHGPFSDRVRRSLATGRVEH